MSLLSILTSVYLFILVICLVKINFKNIDFYLEKNHTFSLIMIFLFTPVFLIKMNNIFDEIYLLYIIPLSYFLYIFINKKEPLYSKIWVHYFIKFLIFFIVFINFYMFFNTFFFIDLKHINVSNNYYKFLTSKEDVNMLDTMKYVSNIVINQYKYNSVKLIAIILFPILFFLNFSVEQRFKKIKKTISFFVGFVLHILFLFFFFIIFIQIVYLLLSFSHSSDFNFIFNSCFYLFKQQIFIVCLIYYTNIKNLSLIADIKEEDRNYIYIVVIVFQILFTLQEFIYNNLIKENMLHVILILLLISLRNKITNLVKNKLFNLCFFVMFFEFLLMSYFSKNHIENSKISNVIFVEFQILITAFLFFYKETTDFLSLVFFKHTSKINIFEEPKPPHEFEEPKPPHEFEEPKPPHEFEEPKPPHEFEEPKPPHEFEEPKPPVKNKNKYFTVEVKIKKK